MCHAAFNLLDRQARAELKNLEVLRFLQGLESGKVDAARPRAPVVARRKLHIMNVESQQAGRQRFQLEPMMNETQMMLDLGMTRVVPVADHGMVKVAEKILEIPIERNFPRQRVPLRCRTSDPDS